MGRAFGQSLRNPDHARAGRVPSRFVMPIPGTSVDCEGDIPINRTLSAAFFHLISEALTNIRRHTHGWWHGLVLLLKLDGKLPYIATPLPYDFSRSVS